MACQVGLMASELGRPLLLLDTLTHALTREKEQVPLVAFPHAFDCEMRAAT
jgi:hypothetical protein